MSAPSSSSPPVRASGCARPLPRCSTRSAGAASSGTPWPPRTSWAPTGSSWLSATGGMPWSSTWPSVAPHARTAVQDEQLGTGHAVQCALEAAGDVASGTVVVTYGDVPLLTGDTLTALVAQHGADGNAVTVLSARVADPTGYGRIVRADDGTVAGIVEHRDATRRPARHRRDQLRDLRVRRPGDRRRVGPAAPRQRPGRAVPDRCARAGPSRRRPGRGAGHRRRLADRGGQRPRPARCDAPRAQPSGHRGVDARRGHRRGSGHHLGRRHRRARPGCDPRAGHPAAGDHDGRHRRAGRSGHAPGGLPGRRGRPGDPHARHRRTDRTGCPRGAVHVPAARHRPGRGCQGRCLTWR